MATNSSKVTKLGLTTSTANKTTPTSSSQGLNDTKNGNKIELGYASRPSSFVESTTNNNSVGSGINSTPSFVSNENKIHPTNMSTTKVGLYSTNTKPDLSSPNTEITTDKTTSPSFITLSNGYQYDPSTGNILTSSKEYKPSYSASNWGENSKQYVSDVNSGKRRFSSFDQYLESNQKSVDTALSIIQNRKNYTDAEVQAARNDLGNIILEAGTFKDQSKIPVSYYQSVYDALNSNNKYFINTIKEFDAMTSAFSSGLYDAATGENNITKGLDFKNTSSYESGKDSITKNLSDYEDQLFAMKTFVDMNRDFFAMMETENGEPYLDYFDSYYNIQLENLYNIEQQLQGFGAFVDYKNEAYYDDEYYDNKIKEIDASIAAIETLIANDYKDLNDWTDVQYMDAEYDDETTERGQRKKNIKLFEAQKAEYEKAKTQAKYAKDYAYIDAYYGAEDDYTWEGAIKELQENRDLYEGNEEEYNARLSYLNDKLNSKKLYDTRAEIIGLGTDGITNLQLILDKDPKDWTEKEKNTVSKYLVSAGLATDTASGSSSGITTTERTKAVIQKEIDALYQQIIDENSKPFDEIDTTKISELNTQIQALEEEKAEAKKGSGKPEKKEEAFSTESIDKLKSIVADAKIDSEDRDTARRFDSIYSSSNGTAFLDYYNKAEGKIESCKTELDKAREEYKTVKDEILKGDLGLYSTDTLTEEQIRAEMEKTEKGRAAIAKLDAATKAYTTAESDLSYFREHKYDDMPKLSNYKTLVTQGQNIVEDGLYQTLRTVQMALLEAEPAKDGYQITTDDVAGITQKDKDIKLIMDSGLADNKEDAAELARILKVYSIDDLKANEYFSTANTAIYKHNADGSLVYDEDGNPVLDTERVTDKASIFKAILAKEGTLEAIQYILTQNLVEQNNAIAKADREKIEEQLRIMGVNSDFENAASILLNPWVTFFPNTVSNAIDIIQSAKYGLNGVASPIPQREYAHSCEVVNQAYNEFLQNTGVKVFDRDLAFYYGAYTSTANFVEAAATGNLLGGALGLTGEALNLFTSAISDAAFFTNAMSETLQKNLHDPYADQDKAWLTATAAGIAEAAFEKFSLENFINIGATTRPLIEMALGQGIEISEEYATELTNMLSDYLVNGYDSEFNKSIRNYQANGYSLEESEKKANEDLRQKFVDIAISTALSTGISIAPKVHMKNVAAKSRGRALNDTYTATDKSNYGTNLAQSIVDSKEAFLAEDVQKLLSDRQKESIDDMLAIADKITNEKRTATSLETGILYEYARTLPEVLQNDFIINNANLFAFDPTAVLSAFTKTGNEYNWTNAQDVANWIASHAQNTNSVQLNTLVNLLKINANNGKNKEEIENRNTTAAKFVDNTVRGNKTLTETLINKEVDSGSLSNPDVQAVVIDYLIGKGEANVSALQEHKATYSGKEMSPEALDAARLVAGLNIDVSQAGNLSKLSNKEKAALLKALLSQAWRTARASDLAHFQFTMLTSEKVREKATERASLLKRLKEARRNKSKKINELRKLYAYYKKNVEVEVGFPASARDKGDWVKLDENSKRITRSEFVKNSVESVTKEERLTVEQANAEFDKLIVSCAQVGLQAKANKDAGRDSYMVKWDLATNQKKGIKEAIKEHTKEDTEEKTEDKVERKPIVDQRNKEEIAVEYFESVLTESGNKAYPNVDNAVNNLLYTLIPLYKKNKRITYTATVDAKESFEKQQENAEAYFAMVRAILKKDGYTISDITDSFDATRKNFKDGGASTFRATVKKWIPTESELEPVVKEAAEEKAEENVEESAENKEEQKQEEEKRRVFEKESDYDIAIPELEKAIADDKEALKKLQEELISLSSIDAEEDNSDRRLEIEEEITSIKEQIEKLESAIKKKNIEKVKQQADKFEENFTGTEAQLKWLKDKIFSIEKLYYGDRTEEQNRLLYEYKQVLEEILFRKELLEIKEDIAQSKKSLEEAKNNLKGVELFLAEDKPTKKAKAEKPEGYEDSGVDTKRLYEEEDQYGGEEITEDEDDAISAEKQKKKELTDYISYLEKHITGLEKTLESMVLQDMEGENLSGQSESDIERRLYEVDSSREEYTRGYRGTKQERGRVVSVYASADDILAHANLDPGKVVVDTRNRGEIDYDSLSDDERKVIDEANARSNGYARVIVLDENSPLMVNVETTDENGNKTTTKQEIGGLFTVVIEEELYGKVPVVILTKYRGEGRTDGGKLGARVFGHQPADGISWTIDAMHEIDHLALDSMSEEQRAFYLSALYNAMFADNDMDMPVIDANGNATVKPLSEVLLSFYKKDYGDIMGHAGLLEELVCDIKNGFDRYGILTRIEKTAGQFEFERASNILQGAQEIAMYRFEMTGFANFSAAMWEKTYGFNPDYVVPEYNPSSFYKKSREAFFESTKELMRGLEEEGTTEENFEKKWLDSLPETEVLWQNIVKNSFGINSTVTKQSNVSFSEALGFDKVDRSKADKNNPDLSLLYVKNGVRQTEVTVDDVNDSPIGALINYSYESGFISEEEMELQKKLFADMGTLFARSPDFAMTQAFVGSEIFTAMKANSDKQYNTTYDMVSIFTKTQAIIDAMSAAMMFKGRGLSPKEIAYIYAKVNEMGNPVNCPECYVFSRWVGIASLLDNIWAFQTRYDGMTEKAVREEYEQISNRIKAKQKELGIDITRGKAKGKLVEELEAEYEKLKFDLENSEIKSVEDEKRFKALGAEVVSARALRWIETVYFTDESLKNKRERDSVNGKEGYFVPKEVLFNLNAGGEFAQNYRAAWKFRTSQGAGYGKAITPYAEVNIGEGFYGTNSITNLINKKEKGNLNNIFLNQRGTLDSSARKILANARRNQLSQAFLGGQRWQSVSDARPETLTDYIMAALELQAMKGRVQVYTKVPGAVDFFDAIRACTNMSLMPKGSGLDKDGNPVDTEVGGINPNLARELRETNEHAGTITIGVNDKHIRAMFNQYWRDFIIPYHLSGGNTLLIAEMRKIQNPELGIPEKSVDYTQYQGEKVLSDELLRGLGKTEQEIDTIHKTREARKLILTGKIFKGDTYNQYADIIRNNEFLSNLYSEFKDGIWFDRSISNKASECRASIPVEAFKKTIFPNEFWDTSVDYEHSYVNVERYLAYCDSLGFLHKFSGKKPGTASKAHQEDTGAKSELKVGYAKDNKGNRIPLTDLAYIDGDEANGIEPFYWKSIVDRRMYGNAVTDEKGNVSHPYIKQMPITLSSLNMGLLVDENPDSTTGPINFANSKRYTKGGRMYDQQISQRTVLEIIKELDDGTFDGKVADNDLKRGGALTEQEQEKLNKKLAKIQKFAKKKDDGITKLSTITDINKFDESTNFDVSSSPLNLDTFDTQAKDLVNVSADDVLAQHLLAFTTRGRYLNTIKFGTKEYLDKELKSENPSITEAEAMSMRIKSFASKLRSFYSSNDKKALDSVFEPMADKYGIGLVDAFYQTILYKDAYLESILASAGLKNKDAGEELKSYLGAFLAEKNGITKDSIKVINPNKYAEYNKAIDNLPNNMSAEDINSLFEAYPELDVALNSRNSSYFNTEEDIPRNAFNLYLYRLNKQNDTERLNKIKNIYDILESQEYASVFSSEPVTSSVKQMYATQYFSNIASDIFDVVNLNENGNINIISPLFFQGKHSVEEMYDAYYPFAESEEIKNITQKVFSAAKILGLQYQFSDEKYMAPGEYFRGTKDIVLNKNYFDATDYAESFRVVLHETIHGISSYVLDIYENKSKQEIEELIAAGKFTQGMYEAAKAINDIYNELKKNDWFNYNESFGIGEYAARNTHEMIAELSNPMFREQIRYEGVLTKILNAIKKLLGIEVNEPIAIDGIYEDRSSALEALDSALEYLVTRPNKNAYDYYTKELYSPEFYSNQIAALASLETKAANTKFSKVVEASEESKNLYADIMAIDNITRDRETLSEDEKKAIESAIINAFIKQGFTFSERVFSSKNATAERAEREQYKAFLSLFDGVDAYLNFVYYANTAQGTANAKLFSSDYASQIYDKTNRKLFNDAGIIYPIIRDKIGTGINPNVTEGRKDFNWAKDLFYQLNEDAGTKELADKVFAVAEKLNLRIYAVPKTKYKNTPGLSWGRNIEYDFNYLNNRGNSNQKKASLILHEIIHATAVYVIKTDSYSLPMELADAKKLALNTYDMIKADKTGLFNGDYGLTDAHEMLAELSNPVFVEKLKKKGLWQNIVNFFRKIFGIEPSTAYDSASAALERMLDEFYVVAFENYAQKADRDIGIPNYSEAQKQEALDEYLATHKTDAKYSRMTNKEIADTFPVASAITLFSGGGTFEQALLGLINTQRAVEISERATLLYRLNYGAQEDSLNELRKERNRVTKLRKNGDNTPQLYDLKSGGSLYLGDVRDFVSGVELLYGIIDYLHASPSCQNFSSLKSKKREDRETEVDRTTAQATADTIEKVLPKIVTIENVPEYLHSSAYKRILDILNKFYVWDDDVYVSSDYGAPTYRKRMFTRAIRLDVAETINEIARKSGQTLVKAHNGYLIAKPEKNYVGNEVTWLDAIGSQISEFKDYDIPNFARDRLINGNNIDINNVSEPLLVMYGRPDGKEMVVYDSSEPAGAVRRKNELFVLLPGGVAKKVDTQAFANIQGLTNYVIPPANARMKVDTESVIGNGIPVALTRSIVVPLIGTYNAETKFSTISNENEETEYAGTKYSLAAPTGLTEKQIKAIAYNTNQTEIGSDLKTLSLSGGSLVARNKKILDGGAPVGKPISGSNGTQIYIHKNYATTVMDKSVYAKAVNTLKNSYPNFEWNTIVYMKGKDGYEYVRFDEAPDFDTAREPIPGNYVNVNATTGEVIGTGNSQYIWHHKWMWVRNDYNGFDVGESWNWSKLYLSVIRDTKNPAIIPGTSKATFDNRGIANGSGKNGVLWNEQLRYFGLPLEGETANYDEETEADKWMAYLISNNPNSSTEEQKYQSDKTSQNQVPISMTNYRFKNDDRVLDWGGGAYDTARLFMEDRYPGIMFLAYDPYNRTKSYNKEVLDEFKNNKASVLSINNVLNVIDSDVARRECVSFSKEYLMDNGMCIFVIYEGDGSGIGKVTKTGEDRIDENGKVISSSSFQTNVLTKDYIPMIKEYYEYAVPHGNIIFASDNKEAISAFEKQKLSDEEKKEVSEIIASKYIPMSVNMKDVEHIQGNTETKAPEEFTKLSKVWDAENPELFAAHNISTDNLLNAINLGGFPMPSIGIIRPDAKFDHFGEYTVIFNKNAIDPMIDGNYVYGYDAWTPMYPPRRFVYNADDVAKFDEDMARLAAQFSDDPLFTPVTMESLLVDGTPKMEQIYFVRNLNRDDGVKAAYVVDRGLDVQYSKDYKTTAKRLLDAVTDNEEDFDNWFNEKFNKVNKISEVAARNGRYLEETLENVTDIMTHYPVQVGGGLGAFEMDALMARVVPAYQTINDIKQDSKRLTVDRTDKSRKEYRKIREALPKLREALILDGYDYDDDYEAYRRKGGKKFEGDFYGFDLVEKSFAKAAENFDINDIEGSRKKVDDAFGYNGITVSEKNLDTMLDLFTRAASLDTPYFEAKPRKAITFDSVMAVVAPNIQSAQNEEIAQKLNDMGISIVTYKDNDSKDRIRAMNEVSDAKFSKVSTGEQIKGFNVSDSQVNYTDRIFAEDPNDRKTIETRPSRSLDSLIGKRVAVISTDSAHGQKAYIAGWVTVGEPFELTEDNFNDYYNQHWVAPTYTDRRGRKRANSYYIQPGQTKWAYPLISPVKSNEQEEVEVKGNVIRNLPSTVHKYSLVGPERNDQYADEQKNTAVYNDEHFFIGLFDTRDGSIVKTAPYSETVSQPNPFGDLTDEEMRLFGEGTYEIFYVDNSNLIIGDGGIMSQEHLSDLGDIPYILAKKLTTPYGTEVTWHGNGYSFLNKLSKKTPDDLVFDELFDGSDKAYNAIWKLIRTGNAAEFTAEVNRQYAGLNGEVNTFVPKNNLPIDTSNDTRATVQTAMDKLIRKNGRLKEGENAVDEGRFPERNDEGEYFRRMWRTISGSSNLTNTPFHNAQFNQSLTNDLSTYQRTSNASLLDYADKEFERIGSLDKMFDKWKIMMDEDQRIDGKTIAFGEKLLVELANRNQGDDLQKALEVSGDLCVAGTELGVAVQAFRLLKKMTPAGQMYYLTKTVQRLNKKYEKQISKGKMKPIEISADDARAIMSAGSVEELTIAVEVLKQDIANQIPVTFWDRWNAWRYLAMLGNFPTHARNFLGNAGFYPVAATKNIIAAAYEDWFSSVDPSMRTKSFRYMLGGAPKELVDFATDYFEKQKDMIAGKNSKYNVINELLAKRDIWGAEDEKSITAFLNRMSDGKFGRAMNAFQDINSDGLIGWMSDKAYEENWSGAIGKGLQTFKEKGMYDIFGLETGDIIFQKKYYINTLANFLAARGVTNPNFLLTTKEGGKILAEANAWAIREAQRNTYRDYNAIASGLNRLKATKANWFVEGIMPFTKTPMNILMRGIEYSPIGVVIGIKRIMEARNIENEETRKAAILQAIDYLAAGTTGIMVMAVGFALSALGLLRGTGSGDDKEKEFEKLLGHQDYAVEILDDDGNGVSVTIDWLAPESMPLFVGAKFHDMIANGASLSIWEIPQAMALLAEPMLSMSMLEGLENLINTAAYADSGERIATIGLQILGSYLTQGLPTLGAQVARSIVPDRRTTYVDKNSAVPVALQRFIQSSVMAKIPGLNNMRSTYVDAWGRTDTQDSWVLRWMENLLSPGYINEVKTTEVDRELMKLYEATQNSSLFPSTAQKEVNLPGGNKIYLTAEEYEQLAKSKGQTSYALLSEIFNDSLYAAIEDFDEKQKIVSTAYDYSKQTAIRNMYPDYKVDSWIDVANKIDVPTYVIMKSDLAEATSYSKRYDLVLNTPGLSQEDQAKLISSLYNASGTIESVAYEGYKYEMTDADEERLEELVHERFTEPYITLVNSTAFTEVESEEARDAMIDEVRAIVVAECKRILATEIDADGSHDKILSSASSINEDETYARAAKMSTEDAAKYIASRYSITRIDSPSMVGYELVFTKEQQKEIKAEYSELFEAEYKKLTSSTEYKSASSDMQTAKTKDLAVRIADIIETKYAAKYDNSTSGIRVEKKNPTKEQKYQIISTTPNITFTKANSIMESVFSPASSINNHSLTHEQQVRHEEIFADIMENGGKYGRYSVTSFYTLFNSASYKAMTSLEKEAALNKWYKYAYDISRNVMAKEQGW